MSRGPAPRTDAAFVETVRDAFATASAYDTARRMVEEDRRKDARAAEIVNRRERQERRSLGRWP